MRTVINKYKQFREIYVHGLRANCEPKGIFSLFCSGSEPMIEIQFQQTPPNIFKFSKSFFLSPFQIRVFQTLSRSGRGAQQLYYK